MRSILEQSGLATALFLITLPVAAHHSRAPYDRQRTVTFEGVVTEYEWANPHVYLYVQTPTDSGDTVVWELESNTTTIMRRRGWSPDTFAPGDRVTVRGNPARDPARKMVLVGSVTRGGVTFFDNDGISAALDGSETSPVKADDLSGIWEVPLLPFIGQFSDASSWPLTPKAVEAVEAYDDRTMNPQIQCLARTAPWLMIFTGVHEIEVSDRSISIRTEYDAVERTVHMDLTSHDGVEPTHQGHSIGRWEGEALVVDTTHFADHRSGNARGLPSGAQKHLVERFELSSDRTHLTYRFELEDPEYLTAPVTGELQSTYRPDLDFVPIACDLENARRFVGD